MVVRAQNLISFVFSFPSIFFLLDSGRQDIFSGTTHLSDSSTLILDRVDRHHAGVYQCAADNGVRDPVSMDITLTILCKCFGVKLFIYDFIVVVVVMSHMTPDPTHLCLYSLLPNLYLRFSFQTKKIFSFRLQRSTTGNNSWTKLDTCQWRLRHWIGLHCSWRCNFGCKWTRHK